ncbi:MAG: hypothetical protein QI199_01335, partial [Candidatus Korarchaeota archaeon]|nr:hypothetical protein [Candidatus Korarchaeota archaeon]
MLTSLVMRDMRWGGSASLLLTEAGVRIALTAWRPLARSQILRQSGLPRRTFDRWFSKLLEARALVEMERGYVARPWVRLEGSWGTLRELLSGYMSYLARSFQVRGAVVWTNGWQAILASKADLDLPLTAFSAFHLYGMKPLLARREYALPERKLTIQDIYDHACLLAEDPRGEGLCREFYEDNKGLLGDEGGGTETSRIS